MYAPVLFYRFGWASARGDVTVSDPANFLLDAGLVPGVALGPGETELLTIQFAPQAQGNISGEISVSSNDPDDNPLLIPLFGVGGDSAR